LAAATRVTSKPTIPAGPGGCGGEGEGGGEGHDGPAKPTKHGGRRVAVECACLPEPCRFVLLRAGDSAAFIFDGDTVAHPDARMRVRLTDNAGLHRQIDHDLHLTGCRTAPTLAGLAVFDGQFPRRGVLRQPGTG
jgi:hypothetical protein